MPQPAAWPIDAADAVALHQHDPYLAVGADGRADPRSRRLLPAGRHPLSLRPVLSGRRHTAPSNLAFDRDLRARNPAWGMRALEDVVALAARHGFAPPLVIEMPANNLSLVFRRA